MDLQTLTPAQSMFLMIAGPRVAAKMQGGDPDENGGPETANQSSDRGKKSLGKKAQSRRGGKKLKASGGGETELTQLVKKKRRR